MATRVQAWSGPMAGIPRRGRGTPRRDTGRAGRAGRRGRRSAAVLAAVAVVLATTSLSPLAPPAEAEGFVVNWTEVCDGFGGAPFSDLGSTHADAIGCMYSYTGPDGKPIVQGLGDGTFGTRDPITRQQFASLVVRFLFTADPELEVPTPAHPGFDDVTSATHGPNVELLATFGVIKGTSDTTFDPRGTLTRGQAATILEGALEVLGTDLPDAVASGFDDLGSTHRGAIETLATAGIVAGQTPTTFGYGAALERGAIATLLARSAQVLLDDGRWAAPLLSSLGPVSDAPELIAVAVGASTATQTVLAFTFDEPIAPGVTATSFGIYGYDGLRATASAAQRSGSDLDTVLATFPVGEVAVSTTAAVDLGAVSNLDGLGNLPGAQPLKAVTIDTYEGRKLISIGDYVDGTVQFVFDGPVTNTGPDGSEGAEPVFLLFRRDGSAFVAERADATQPPFAPDVLRVRVPGLTEAGWQDVVRGYVTSADLVDLVPFERVVDVREGGVTPGRPNLTSVSIDPAGNHVEVTFSEPLNQVFALQPSAFRAVRADGTVVQPLGADHVVGTTSTVRLVFASMTIDDSVVGVSVQGGAVANLALADNQSDSIDRSFSVPAGRTFAPELLGAELEASGVDLLTGEVTEYTVTLTYDEVSPQVDASHHWLVLSEAVGGSNLVSFDDLALGTGNLGVVGSTVVLVTDAPSDLLLLGGGNAAGVALTPGAAIGRAPTSAVNHPQLARW